MNADLPNIRRLAQRLEHPVDVARLDRTTELGREDEASVFPCRASLDPLRNTAEGYWIAEAQPEASDEAIRRTFGVSDVAWAVLATDGAQRPIDHLGLSWEDIALMATSELSLLLQRLHDWEQFEDPTAKLLPRAKQHDDKVVVPWYPERWVPFECRVSADA